MPANFAGRSLLPLATGAGRFDQELAFSQTANHRRPHLFSVRSPSWKLHVSPDGGIEELYDLQGDPLERKNLLQQASEQPIAEGLARGLNAWMQATRPLPSSFNPDPITKRLRSLGYFDDETCRLEPIANPFGPKVLPMSTE